MKLTNKLGLPASIVKAVSQHDYKPGKGFSVTTLLAPAYLRKLERENADALEEDAADRIWAMLGTIGHAIAERAAEFNALSEERLGAELDGHRITGQVDLFDKDGILSDFKLTTVYKWGGSPDWTAQLNCYAWLLERNGFKVNALQIVAVFRDWQKSKAVSADYPPAQVAVIPVPRWTQEQTEAFLRARLAEHTSDTPTPCSDEERWAKPQVFAVHKAGRKTAVKLHSTFQEATSHMLELGDGHSVAERPRQYPRCENYCRVSHLCPIWKETQPAASAANE